MTTVSRGDHVPGSWGLWPETELVDKELCLDGGWDEGSQYSSEFDYGSFRGPPTKSLQDGRLVKQSRPLRSVFLKVPV